MKPTCAACPVESGKRCIGTHPMHRHACDWASSGDRLKVALVVARSAIEAGESPPEVEPAIKPTIPLAGDLVDALTARLGVDRLAKWVASKLGVDCGCATRRDALNRIDRAARRFLGWS